MATVSGLGYFFLTILSLLMLAFNNANMFYIFDMCEEIFDITDYNDIPMFGTGIAHYLSCLPNDANQKSTAMGYQMYVDYKRGIQLSNDRLNTLGYSGKSITNYPTFLEVFSNN